MGTSSRPRNRSHPRRRRLRHSCPSVTCSVPSECVARPYCRAPGCRSRRGTKLTEGPHRERRDRSGCASAASLTAHFRCRAKNRFPSSPSNCGTPVCPPMLACSVFSLEPKASNRSRARCRSFPSSSLQLGGCDPQLRWQRRNKAVHRLLWPVRPARRATAHPHGPATGSRRSTATWSTSVADPTFFPLREQRLPHRPLLVVEVGGNGPTIGLAADLNG
jgi:hypothetical protein